ncbi:MAG: hypothetical protein IJF48_05325 [Clostridia bacterium]|nr:hypothetical protein [Clostridia bacterium]
MFKLLSLIASSIGIIGSADGPTAIMVAESDFMFEPMNFVKNLSYMGIGMLGIFIVIGLIMIVTFVLNKLFSGNKKDDQ